MYAAFDFPLLTAPQEASLAHPQNVATTAGMLSKCAERDAGKTMTWVLSLQIVSVTTQATIFSRRLSRSKLVQTSYGIAMRPHK